MKVIMYATLKGGKYADMLSAYYKVDELKIFTNLRIERVRK